MISRLFHHNRAPAGAQTMPGDEAFGGFDDTYERPDMSSVPHTGSMAVGNPTFGIDRGGQGGAIGFTGADPMGDDQVATAGLVSRLNDDDGVMTGE